MARAEFLRLHPGSRHFVMVCTCGAAVLPDVPHVCQPNLSRESFYDIDRRLAETFGYQPVRDKLEAMDARTVRIEAAVDRLERGLIRRGSL